MLLERVPNNYLNEEKKNFVIKVKNTLRLFVDGDTSHLSDPSNEK